MVDSIYFHVNPHLLNLFLSYYKIFSKNLGFQWFSISSFNWAMNCDWAGGDLKYISSRSEECYANCLKTVGCTRFTWSKFGGGTCYMKSGSPCSTASVWNGEEGMICGFKGMDSCSGGPNLGNIDVGTNDGKINFLFIFLSTNYTYMYF